MQSIGDFLKKYLDFTPPSRAKKRALAKALTEILRTPFSEKEISVQGTRCFVIASSVIKSEIALRRGNILIRAKELGAGEITELL